jgi:hypothetical protein
MRILILGYPKTGTTAISYMVKNAFPDYDYSFEPADLAAQKGDNLIVKSLLNCPPQRDLFECIDSFDKRIFITRDPRDRFISGLLYRTGFHRDVDIDHCMEILRRKEEHNDVTLREIYREFAGEDITKEEIRVQCRMMYVAYMYDESYCLLRYEDFVDGNLSELEEYLGCDLDAKVDDVGPYGRVSRTKYYGSWRRWFRESDVEIMRPWFAPYMTYFDYGFDWELEDTRIEPRHGSEYFMSLRKERAGG